MSPTKNASPTVVSLEQALVDLPAKLRVHELAKRAGLASKDLIAALAAAGVVVSSAASSVGAADATAVLTSLLSAEPDASPEPDAVAAPEPVDLRDAVEQAAPEQDPGFFAAPLFLPPTEAPAPRRRRATRSAAPADPTLAEAASPPDVTAPVFESPETPEALVDADGSADDTAPDAAGQETGTSRSGRRRRGRSGSRGRQNDAQSDQDADAEAVRGDAGAAVEAVASIGSADLSSDSPSEADDSTEASEVDGTDEDDQAARRRRRRGRRGRGRTGDDRQDDAAEDEQSDSSTAEGESEADGTSSDSPARQDDEEDSVDDDAGDEGGTRRRRRRRRRTGSAESGGEESGREDDPDNTVVHVREPRSAGSSSGGGDKPAGSSSSEVQGVRGSTRLEAKRQRRRDSRGSRSRPQILTEAEFLARREAVDRVMAVRQRGDLAQVALLEDGVLVEHFVSRAGSESLMGNIYLGRVQNVLPSMEAAFVDIGKGRNAVLYAGEVNWDAAGLAGKARRIETALSGGDTLLVQVSKDPVGQKGARLTTQISLPGRFLVYVPGGGATGISRKLPDTERKRLKSILDRIVPEDAGVIIRTAAEGVAEEELARDVERLKTQWEEISRQAEKKSNAPLMLSAEPDTLIKVVRDLFNSDISRLVLDGERAYEPVASYIDAVAPELSERVSRYDGPNDVFTAYRIDEQIAKALERKVYLPSGGSLVIDRTEAMTVVDVNTGKYTGSGGNLEETVTKNNLEAAEEVVRQLRLRDIGGIIVVDFIDMVLESNRELVMRRLTECLGRDRTRHQVAEVTSLGLIQMTRKKMGTGLVEAFSEPCPHCHGRGIVLHDVPMEDRSGGQDQGESDADRRAGRGRRGRGRQDAVAEAEPIVKIVAATVRPPDPRGPKPPTRGSNESHDEHAEPIAASESAQAASAADASSDAQSSAPDSSFNAPLSRDASDAVSAVLAALDARAVRQAESSVAAESSAAPAASPAAEEASAPSGRRRGRRAAGRPAGAPNATGAVEITPVEVAADAALTAEVLDIPTTEADVREAAIPEVVVAAAEVPDVVEVVPVEVAALGVTEPEVTELEVTELEVTQSEAVTPEATPDQPARAGRSQPRRRGSRAAGAATAAPEISTPQVPEVSAPEAGSTVSGGLANGSVEINGAVAGPPESAATAAPEAEPVVVKAAPRRRRAASRPAGPAGATTS
ncbi:ribonuclease E [Nakamurella sp. UYEF19]|uniref:translation initiation factor IF-2 N-terminal domain-containing protein n=1 Tax=Nakamurella sp. UYEF19 TaxID=1756392 RepID=UPI00339B16D1